MESSDCFRFAVKTTGNMIRSRKLAHLFPASVLQIKADEVSGVEIVHSGRSSRSSEMSAVLSVRVLSLPLAASFRNAGVNFRRALNYEV